jgi:predicted MFS family arabinose efflux permease
MFAVLHRNPGYRRLWASQAISLTGDWLNRMALLALITRYSGPEAVLGVGALYGVEMAVRLSPTVVFGGLAGALADRWSRKKIMIGTDLARALTVMGYLLVDSAPMLPLLYGLLVVQMAMSIFFQSARSAALPSTVRTLDLAAAYELSAATWSVVLTVGVLLGGLLVDKLGIAAVFWLDALTYLVSAGILWRLKLGKNRIAPEPFRWREVLLLQDLGRGIGHARERGVGWVVAAKTFWGPAGGFLVLLPLLAARHVADGDVEQIAWLTSLYFAARGVGTGLGPILVRKIWGSSELVHRRQISGGFAVAAMAYSALAFVPDLKASLLLVTLAHMGGSSIWVGSTVLWQSKVDEAFRGRIFSAEFAGMTASFGLAGVVGGFAYDLHQDLQAVLLGTCLAVAICGAIWTYRGRRLPIEN